MRGALSRGARRGLAPALALAAAFAALAAPLPATACSVVAGYRVPSNLELAAMADAIVLGEIVGGTSVDDAAGGADPAVTVRPLAAIKGLLPGQDFTLAGMAIGEIAPSDPLELAAPHPEALAGACIRRTFARGAQVLFFLDRADGEWVPAGGPFSRWAEDIADDAAPWLQLARFYARVAPLEPAQRSALLEAERDALAARADDPAAQAIAADLDRALAAPPPSAVAQAPAFTDDLAETESAVEAALRRMRQAAIEAGN